MQKLIVVALIAGVIPRTDPVLVTRVNDGHSITVQSIGHVRLLGVDVPGAPSASVGRSPARERLESLLLRRWVRLEYDDTGGRAAYVMLETGECINTRLVREGLARVARGRFSRRDELERAEAEARRFRRGIWARYTADRL